MAERELEESNWKAFAKGRGLKDVPLLKALAELDKAEPSKPEVQLKALDEIDKQVEVLRRTNKADKEVVAQLDLLDKAVIRQRKLGEQAAKDAARKAEQQAAEDEEEETPTLLTTKMIPLLRDVRKGAVLQAMIASVGKDCVVLVSRKPIGPPRRKLLTSALGTASGVKFVLGECLLEENAHTFVVQTQAAGLAKKIKDALLKQTEQRFKVRVRGEGGEVDDDGEPGEEGGDSQATVAADPLAQAFEARITRLTPQMQAAARGADAVKVQALADFAQDKARLGNYKAALAALDSLEKLLLAAAGTVPALDPGPAFNARLAALLPHIKVALSAGGGDAPAIKQGVAEAGELARGKHFDAAQARLDAVEGLLSRPAARREPSLLQLQQARLSWDGLRKTVQRQLQSLEQGLLDSIRAHNQAEDAEFRFDEAEVAQGVRRLYTVLDGLDERLIDTLDEALNASGEQRRALNARAGKLVAEYRGFVEADPLIAVIDNNGFVSTSIRSEAQRVLADLARQL